MAMYLAFYVAFEAGKSLLRREEPETSVVSIVLSVVSESGFNNFLHVAPHGAMAIFLRFPVGVTN
jgi:hypothetical protein